ncbi:MAG: hypothetical protein ABI779_00950, partial [Acidobacteriota bacterium]
ASGEAAASQAQTDFLVAYGTYSLAASTVSRVNALANFGEVADAGMRGFSEGASDMTRVLEPQFTEPPIYRGVHARHPALADALEGRVMPADPTSILSPQLHNFGGVSSLSPYTSWTHNFAKAYDFATSEGPGGVVLRLPTGVPPPGATWRWVLSNDAWLESEMLLKGVREGATVIKP